MRKLVQLLALGVCVSVLWAQEASNNAFQIKLSENQREQYDAVVEMDGNLPIPGAAGMAGKLKLVMTVYMQVEKVEEGKATVRTGLEALEAEFNGQPFPVTIEMARSVIPDSTAVVHSNGKLSGLQAGMTIAGFELPGFDPRNLATLLFPVELPEKPLTPGTSWQFSRALSGDPNAPKLSLNARYEGMEELNGTKLHKITQTFEQNIEIYQDAFYQPVADKENALRVTRGQFTGTFTIWCCPNTGLLHRMTLQANVNRTSEPIKKDGSEVKDYERTSETLVVTANVTRRVAQPEPKSEPKKEEGTTSGS
ncbi:MAG: hypothetical protein NZ550_00595 [Fimbriimonadales bacterium]|nr:hypothetical protein [Fimbriimonadales bacterium]MDW8051716.1 hypothetical protein [Armatimonadota bacterium]